MPAKINKTTRSQTQKPTYSNKSIRSRNEAVASSLTGKTKSADVNTQSVRVARDESPPRRALTSTGSKRVKTIKSAVHKALLAAKSDAEAAAKENDDTAFDSSASGTVRMHGVASDDEDDDDNDPTNGWSAAERNAVETIIAPDEKGVLQVVTNPDDEDKAIAPPSPAPSVPLSPPAQRKSNMETFYGGPTGLAAIAAANQSVIDSHASMAIDRKRKDDEEKAKQIEKEAKAAEAAKRSALVQSFKWQANMKDVQPVVDDNFQKEKATADVSGLSTPIEYFRLFWTPELVEDIVLNTNQTGASEKKQKQSIKWQPITKVELDVVVACLIEMSVSRLSNIKKYWSEDHGIRFIYSRIPRDRFLSIWWSLNTRTAPPSTAEEKNDRMYQIRTFVDYLNGRFMANLTAGQKLTLDETMIKYRGLHASIQMMPRKPIRIGFKVWSLSTPSGYILSQHLYEGKKDAKSSKGLTSRVVRALLQPYEGKHHIVVFDSYYTSPQLALALLEQNIYCVGSVRTDRIGWPSDLKDLELKTDNVVTRQLIRCNRLVAMVFRNYKGNKEYISTCTEIKDGAIPTVSVPSGRFDSDGNPIMHSIPDAVRQYNVLMGGVDLSNQYCARPSLWRASKRWWISIFLHYLNCCIVNSWYLYTNHGNSENKKLDLGQFRCRLAVELMGDHNLRTRKIGRPASVNAHHVHVLTTDRQKNGRLVSRPCVSCYHRVSNLKSDDVVGKFKPDQRKHGAVTGYRCSGCDVYVCSQDKNKNCWKNHLLNRRNKCELC